MNLPLTDYILSALCYAEIKKLSDGSYSGKIPECKGVIAFGNNKKKCKDNLRTTLEDWIIVGLRFNHHLPVIDGINLNRDITSDKVASMSPL